ncbi:hypothetical protein NQ317_010347 [Molorchus minor]|uniref:Integrase zinc-binding domain-containing protein n=1 Tax=Molorchus minor TaxID=1323400 RepID=A0ABQ9JT07_9CUCU|nr:hypothetical protein NQ317_010347 [Molorchus minor]
MASLKELIVKRSSIKASLTRFKTFIAKIDLENPNLVQLELRLNKLEQNWETFCEVQTAIEIMDDINFNTHNLERENFENDYFDAVERAKRLIEAGQSQDNIDNKSNSSKTSGKALFGLPTVGKESHLALRQLVDGFTKHFRALEVLEQPVKHWDTLLIYIISEKLDFRTRRDWESKNNKKLPSTDDLILYLRDRCSLLEKINPVDTDKKHKSRSLVCNNDKSNCRLCKENHLLFQCPNFLKMPTNKRYSVVKTHHLCTNCLKSSHKTSDCKGISCKKCHKRHHTLLHFDNVQEDTNNASTSEETTVQTVAGHASANANILLSTAVIKVQDKFGNYHMCRVLLDSGSQSNFITQSLVNKLQTEQLNLNIAVSGLNNSISQIRHNTNVRIMSNVNPFECTINCLIIPRITESLPASTFTRTSLKLPENISLADPKFNESNEIDMLLGSSIFWNLLRSGQIRLGKDKPILQKTVFGWVMAGEIPPSCVNYMQTQCYFISNAQIDNNLSKFWDIEEYANVKPQSPENEAIESYFKSTTLRDADGRFIVRLPLKLPVENLGPSRNIASSDDLHELQQLQHDICQILNAGCFTLNKWVSNNSHVLENISATQPNVILNIGENNETHTLGLLWHSQSDTLSYSIRDNLIKNHLIYLKKYSTLTKLQRVVAYIRRFKNNTLHSRNKSCNLEQRGPLTSKELQDSLRTLTKLVQGETFTTEIKDLLKTSSVNSKSPLLKLNPYIDEDNVIRVGGRLNKSNFNFNKKHPIVLPKNHLFSMLLIRHEHTRLLHAGPQQVLASLRERFWILSARSLVNKVIHNCITCYKINPTGTGYLMADLPGVRVSPSRPFINCAICEIPNCIPKYFRAALAPNVIMIDKERMGLSCIKCFSKLIYEYNKIMLDLSLGVGFLFVILRFLMGRGPGDPMEHRPVTASLRPWYQGLDVKRKISCAFRAQTRLKDYCAPLRVVRDKLSVRKDPVRIILFEECDLKGRNLIFDSHSQNKWSVNAHDHYIISNKEFFMLINKLTVAPP